MKINLSDLSINRIKSTKEVSVNFKYSYPPYQDNNPPNFLRAGIIIYLMTLRREWSQKPSLPFSYVYRIRYHLE